MSAIYDNWERLVAAVLKREELWQLFHAQSRSPSILSEASSFRSSFNLGSPTNDLAFEFSSLGSSSRSRRVPPKLVVISNFSPAVNVNNLHRASTELLGRGTFGSMYSAVMDNGVKIVVKRLKSTSISELDFKHHVDVVGNVRHKNETRVKIAIGAARGLAEIHTQNRGELVHGNIKSSNVFLNGQKYGCVSDLGLANMIETTFMRTTLCYAPEVKSTRNVSQASDVYSFGVVDLVKLVGSVKCKEQAAKVFDEDLLKHPTIREEMVKMLQIGIKCVTKSIKKRPKMMNPQSHGPFRKELVFIENPDPTFDLRDMLRATRATIQAILKSGNPIIVKILWNVHVTYEDFQQHMDVIGRMRHENVAELKAYHFSSDVKILVYDYYNQDSESALLHGTDRASLDPPTRLKITVGAARGIAHIHRQDGGKLVHGNIKSSNIFVNENKYGIVSDVGLAKLIAPIRVSTTATPGYFAPEITDTSEVSQASDVYSFGVVLLEVVCRKHFQRLISVGKVIFLVEWIKYVPCIRWITQVLHRKLLRYLVPEAYVVQLMQIALDCVAILSNQRLRMPEIVKILEEINRIGPSNDVSSLEDQSDETWGQPSLESRLEDLLDDLLPKL
ncbi:Serine/threonine protein kinase [Handroanthus impetiginosus]|uniref:Serine/threonine protein kinase n=1 Tax=Handroanthus impetiginosus TaxID=429701 RepID=A0A2G9GVK5_9LAMI|nr:Serine/threonine protein kinase [Handroanthus impetiginosus]